jgi:hypothetical protein
MEEARHGLPRLNRVHDRHRPVASDEVEQRQAHLGGFADINGGVARQLTLEFVHNVQPNGVVRKDVIAEAEEEDARSRG